MDKEDQELVVGYIRRTFPLQWIDWKFRVEDTPAAACLHQALFENDVTKDLTQPKVREDVTACVLAHENLFSLVFTEVEDLLDKAADAIVAGPSATSTPPAADHTPALAYQCGLQPGDRIELIKSFESCDRHGQNVERYVAGQIWEVLRPRKDDPVLWLRRPDGCLHTWTDDVIVFEHFRPIHDGKTVT